MKLLDAAIPIIIALLIMLAADFVLREVEFDQNKVVIEDMR